MDSALKNPGDVPDYASSYFQEFLLCVLEFLSFLLGRDASQVYAMYDPDVTQVKS